MTKRATDWKMDRKTDQKMDRAWNQISQIQMESRPPLQRGLSLAVEIAENVLKNCGYGRSSGVLQ